jgi:hypothetical protein
MFAPKPISADSIPGALARAERYRLLNEPSEAESICLDILAVEPQNQQALVSLILALTDQLPDNPAAWRSAMESAARLSADYDRLYYEGIVWERRAKARYHGGGTGGREHVYDWLMRALELFERAERVRPAGNDDAVLRWNACVRFLKAHRELVPGEEPVPEPILSE